jgi:hypothetical protein
MYFAILTNKAELSNLTTHSVETENSPFWSQLCDFCQLESTRCKIFFLNLEPKYHNIHMQSVSEIRVLILTTGRILQFRKHFAKFAVF